MHLEQELQSLSKELFPMGGDLEIRFENPIEFRKKIDRFEDLAKSISTAQLQISTTHRFAKGLYAREIFIPKGTILIGRIHKSEGFSIMSMGDKTVLTEDGVKRLKPPFCCVSKPGIKRVGFAHEDSIWTTFHATNARTVEEVEKELFVPTYEEAEKPSEADLIILSMEGFLCQQ